MGIAFSFPVSFMRSIELHTVMSFKLYWQPRNMASCKYELVDAIIRVC